MIKQLKYPDGPYDKINELVEEVNKLNRTIEELKEKIAQIDFEQEAIVEAVFTSDPSQWDS